MSLPATTRVDLHCHSTASERSKLRVARSMGLPECATPPEEVYRLAKKRGMDFVTITDHDTIAGCLELADRPDCFISVELTAGFAGEPQAVHVLCFGITPGDHEWLQEHRGDLEACAEYLDARGIACGLAHPFYDVAAALTPRHRRRLGELFGVWEVRNGSRAPELNRPAAIYAETRGVTGIGGSDDHAGVDIGRTFTESPPAASPAEFLEHVRAGRARALGDQGGAAKWAHAAIALATRAFASGARSEASLPPDPAAVYGIATRLISEAASRGGEPGADFEPADAVALLDAWVDSIGLGLRGPDLIAYMQEEGFSHAELYRRARHVHAARLGGAIKDGVQGMEAADLGRVATGLFAAMVPAVPYAAAAALVGREKARLSPQSDLPRVAIVADGIGAVHGVTHTIERIRERGVPGFEVDVIGTDRRVDRRLPSVEDFDLPFYEGLQLGVPALPDLVEVLAEGGYDLLHVTAPGPVGVMAMLLAGACGMPVTASHHTELTSYARLRAGDRGLEQLAEALVGSFFKAADIVLSPSEAADESLRALGVDGSRLARWERGVDTKRFRPAVARTALGDDVVNVLYVGRISREKGIDLMAESFLRAREADPRLHLLVVGRGPEEDHLREMVGDAATFLGWRDGDELPRAYGLGDMFLFCSRTDTYGQVVMEAGACALPVVAVAEGGPASLVGHRTTGLLCPPDADQIASSILELAASPTLRRDLGIEGRLLAMERSWGRALQQLAEGYRLALGPATAEPVSAVPIQATPDWYLGSARATAA